MNIGCTKNYFSKSQEAYLYLRRHHAIFLDEVKKAMNYVVPGREVEIYDRRERETIAGPVISKTRIKRVIGHIIEFTNGLTCTDVDWAAYLRNPSIAIGGHFR